MRHPDHTIIATAKAIQSDCENRKTILVSRDINMRVICDSIGLEAQDYISEKAAASFEEMYNGFIVQSFDDEVIDRFYAGEDIMLTEDEANK
jgi:PhoH-like ATPase